MTFSLTAFTVQTQQRMSLLWGGRVGRRDKWTVPAGVNVKDWTAKQEDREVVC